MTAPRLPKRVLKALDGHDWSLARGGKHWRLLVDGRQVVVLGTHVERGDYGSSRRVAALVRRFVREGGHA